MPAIAWALCLAALVVGLAVGQVLSRVVAARVGGIVVVVLGLVGAASAIRSGITMLG